MRSREEILDEIAKIENDPRYSYPDANIMVNAYLAIAQVEMRTILKWLRWVLNPGICGIEGCPMQGEPFVFVKECDEPICITSVEPNNYTLLEGQ